MLVTFEILGYIAKVTLVTLLRLHCYNFTTTAHLKKSLFFALKTDTLKSL